MSSSAWPWNSQACREPCGCGAGVLRGRISNLRVAIARGSCDERAADNLRCVDSGLTRREDRKGGREVQTEEWKVPRVIGGRMVPSFRKAGDGCWMWACECLDRRAGRRCPW